MSNTTTETAGGLTLTHVHDEGDPDLIVTIGNHPINPDKVSIDVDNGRVALVNRADLLEAIGGEQPHAEVERPEWLEAEVIRADLDGEFVFAVRDEDNDWMVYGGKCDGDYVVYGEAEDEFSNVEIVKA